MRLPNDDLSPEAHAAIVACLRVFASRGRQLRLEHEVRERQKNVTPVKPLRGVAGGADSVTGQTFPVAEGDDVSN